MTQKPTATLPTPSNRPAFVVVGNPGCRRVVLFQEALARCRLPAAALVSYAELLAGRVTLDQVVGPGTIVRLESPGRDFEVEKAMLAVGADEPDKDGPTRISREEAGRLAFDKGRIWYPRQWYLGFRALLRRLGEQLARFPPCVRMNRPADVEVLFDKVRCQDRFARAGIPVPRGLGPVRSFDQLRQQMREADCRSVFVKLAHGSSASGVVAYRTSGARQEALTTVEMVRHNGELRLYNSRLIRRYHRLAEVARLVDALAREGVQVEEWLPKAGLGDHVFDLRVVVIAGAARHVVVRMSQSPMTNLHLQNRRGDLSAVVARMSPEAWQAARRTCERTGAVFPDSLHLGVDLLIARDYRQHAVLEANAFGDLLPEVLSEGVDTYEAEVRAVLAGSRGFFPFRGEPSPSGGVW
jgi:glutathione synthase/RimK-type ligase-like ATP-grasp enzyme